MIDPALRKRLRLPLMIGGPALVFVVALSVYLTGGRYEATDDAYVQTASVAVSSNVAGRVQELDVHDNQLVHKGEVLFRLDDEPFRIAVEEAEAQLSNSRLQVESLKASYRQRQAELQSARETLTYQERETARQQRLLAAGISSQLQVDRTVHALDTAHTELAAAEQQLGSVLANLGGDPNIAPDRHPMVQQAQALLDRAKLNLSYTVIKAPSDGIVTRVEQLQVGTYITASAPVFALVVSGNLWIEANFKENQLTHMRVGQIAEVYVDSYPGKKFEGLVVSVSPGTGSQFSVLPPENATGNWVKVVQRLPVRVELRQPDPDFPLQGGLSATVSVDTGHERHLFSFGEAVAGHGRSLNTKVVGTAGEPTADGATSGGRVDNSTVNEVAAAK
jgi:membrane fusion protein, multidrug efflux system